MNRSVLVALSACLLNCHGRAEKTNEEKALDADIEEIRKQNPGIREECLAKVRSGQAGALDWVNNTDCFEMMPARRWSGLWDGLGMDQLLS